MSRIISIYETLQACYDKPSKILGAQTLWILSLKNVLSFVKVKTIRVLRQGGRPPGARRGEEDISPQISNKKSRTPNCPLRSAETRIAIDRAVGLVSFPGARVVLVASVGPLIRCIGFVT